MPEVFETELPGIGVRHDFEASSGDRLGVVSHASGRRQLVVYDRRDPDACRVQLDLDSEDCATLAELLGGTRVSVRLAELRHRVEGLAIEWIVVGARSPLAGRTIGDGEIRARTGASVVAVVRDDRAEPAPGPNFRLEVGDVAVVIGTVEGVAAAGRLIGG